MIVDNGKYYLYRHIRVDKNEPFYVGIGTKSKYGDLYKRANNTKARNFMWLSVFNKTPIEIDVMMESDSIDFISKKEEEFISLYGRKSKNNGTLVNIEKGGYVDRTYRRDNWRKSASERMAKMNTENAKKRVGTNNFNILSRKVYVYSLSGGLLFGFDSMVQCSQYLGYGFKANIIARKIDSSRSYMNYYFCSYQKEKIDTSNFIISKNNVDYSAKKIAKIDKDGNIIKTYETMKLAEIDNNLSKGTLYKSLKTKNSKIKKTFKYL